MNALYPEKLYVEVTTHCNLQCAKCVKYSSDADIRDLHMDMAIFSQLSPLLKHAKTLVLNGIGEPLVHPELAAMITFARSRMSPRAKIGFQSNGLLLTDTCAKKLMHAGLDTICFSVDDFSPTSHGGEHSFPMVMRAVNILKLLRKTQVNSIEIGLEIVLKKDNYHQLPILVSWAADNGIDFILATHLVPYEKDLEDKVLFRADTLRAELLVEKYRRKGASLGLHLHEGYEDYRKFAGTKTDGRLLTLLHDLQEEAKRQNIQLNLKTLLHRDFSSDKDVAKAVDDAREIAKTGLVKLHLPTSHSHDQDERVCPFIRDKALFIAADGTISPCHFLWHTYSCRVNSETIQVNQQSLGNLAVDNPLEIWQDKEHQRFRAEAEGGDYSPCWSCPLAPCPNLVIDNITQVHDCYGSNVPCGHCHWNLGGFNCM